MSFKLGIGLISKSYNISNLKSCKPVTNSPLNGIGIRMLPNGWLYNVTGLKAIELQFKNKKSIVRIGTNRPEEICELVQSVIGGGAIANESIEGQTKKWTNPLWIISVLLVLGLIFIPNYTETKVTVGSNEFKIKGV